MAGEELKNDLVSILDVRAENLVETLTALLSKLNDTGVEMDESLTVDSATDAAEELSGSISAAAVAAAEVAAAAVAAAAVSATAVLAAAEAAVVLATAAAAAVTASSLLQPPSPVVYTTRAQPKPFEMVELDKDAFKVLDKYGKPRSDAAACRAVNKFVNTILGDYFSDKYMPKQLVLALRLLSKHPDVRMLFKSARLTDIEDLEALRFQNEQIHCILRTTNDSKNKGGATDVIIWISASYLEHIPMISMKCRPPYLSYIPHILSTYL
jgi:hypothetical protein